MEHEVDEKEIREKSERKKLLGELYEWCKEMECSKCPYNETAFCTYGELTLAKLREWKEDSELILAFGRRKGSKAKAEKPKYAMHGMNLYRYRRRHGLCVKCGEKAQGGRVTCDKCNKKIKEQYQKKRRGKPKGTPNRTKSKVGRKRKEEYEEGGS